ncbi:putative Ribosome maturation protein SDO1 like protein [Blattamonas nauphoetae]|uniref:Ribosome maturation protein SDO1 like protein n=1 Tax=Blattamonas nauphoetae TaxID=2049346 RepID=A0ABQ9YFD4_9EUKA|nr:putative Ribosome maturation protein SDO1 like protein [Blattamonas nauphoetae]
MASKQQVCQLKRNGVTLEVLCKPGTVAKWKEGNLGIDNVILSDDIFKNHTKLERASDQDVETGTGHPRGMAAVEFILQNGEIALTTAERREKVEQRRREILGFINSYYVDPSTNLPHPIPRLETAMESFRYIIDPFRDGSEQALEVVEKMRDVLPIRKNVMEGTLFVPHKYLSQCQGIVKKYCDKGREKYDGKGCTMEIGVIPGNFDRVMAELNKVTHGEHELTFSTATAPKPAAAGSGKGKGAPKRGKK